ncbi:MAG: ectoine hydroxylase-related dioxygenase (phytanoyl-CoA dioxygenase family) [Candidatus Latescibacterota bacterium]|jgi:ectoine hydroxylase-related dioxygenase (phytanoyl-CoA dioxygenase family)
MTPEELYRYDLNGYLLLRGAIDPDTLRYLNKQIDVWEEKAQDDFCAKSEGANPEVRYDDIVNQEAVLIPLAANPKVVPYIVEMMEKPRLKSTWIAFKWRGGETRLHSNHTPSVTHNFYHFNGQIRHNLLNLMYAMHDIEPGGGGLKVIPGSHKANYPRTRGDDASDLLVELSMKAGDVLLFSHDMGHCSLNESDAIRRTVMYTYCPGVISNSFGGDTLYDRIFEAADEGSWLKYLTRRPNGFLETYPQPNLSTICKMTR